MSNAKSLMRVMKSFHHVSGLKIHNIKSKVYRIGKTFDQVERLTSGMGCMPDKYHFTYLGMPIGSYMRRKDSWKIMISLKKTFGLEGAKHLFRWSVNVDEIGSS